jgi:hypothetical protein
MARYWVTEPAICQNFSGTLKNKANNWFTRLPFVLVHNFAQLSDQFLAQFSYKIPMKKAQKVNESLKDYLHRFNLDVLLVDDMDKEFMKN